MRTISGLTEEQIFALEMAAEAAMRVALQQVMDTIADRIAAIQTASALVAADGSEVPPPPPSDGVPPGQPYVSPDDLASVTPLWDAAAQQLLLPIVAQAWQDSSGAVYAGMVDATGISALPSVGSLAAEQYLAQARATFAEVGTDLWSTARDELLDGFAQGESIPQLAQRLRDSAALTAPTATLVARTQVIEASNAGSIATARASGLSMVKEWVATMDPRTRPTHLQADGQRVGLDEPFTVGGWPADFPAAPTLPPAERYNCRCTHGYVMAEQQIHQGQRDAIPPEPIPGTSGSPVDELAADLHTQVEDVAAQLHADVERTFAEVDQAVADLGIQPSPPVPPWRAGPLRGLPSAKKLDSMTVAQLRGVAKEEGIVVPPGTRKPELLQMLKEKRAAAPPTPVKVARAGKRGAVDPNAAPAGSGTVGPQISRLPRTPVTDARAAAMEANPRYGQAYHGPTTAEIDAAGGATYTFNCTRVAITQELRRRGVAVTAGAGTQLGDTTAAYMHAFRSGGRYAVRVTEDLRRNMSLREIVAEVETWPPGSRGIITLQGHTLNVERELSGRVIFVDAQAAARQTPIMDVTSFRRRMASRGVPTDRFMAVARVDDLDMSDYALRFVESPELDLANNQIMHSSFLRVGDRFATRDELLSMAPDDVYPPRGGLLPRGRGAETRAGPGLRGLPERPLTPAEFDRRLESAATDEDALRAASVKLDDTSRVARVEGLDSLTAEQRQVIANDLRLFGGRGSIDANQFLRDPSHIPIGMTVAQRDAMIRSLDEAFDHASLSRDAVLYRGSSGVEMFGEDISQWPADLAGTTWTQPGYTSLSARRHLAETFRRQEGGVLARILVPRGAPAIQVDEYAREAELLLSRGWTFRVVRDYGLVPAENQNIGGLVRLLDVEAIPPAVRPPLPGAPLRSLPVKAAPRKAAARVVRPPSPAVLRRQVTERGVVPPTGLRQSALERLAADLESGVSPGVARARAVVTIADERRAVAGALSEVDFALQSGASDRAVAFLASEVDRLPVELKARAQLAQALRSGNREDIRKAAAALQREAKLKPAGAAGDTLPFDRQTMTLRADTGQAAGAEVQVTKPGYTTVVDGQPLTIRATVTEVSDAVKARRARAAVKARQAEIEARTPTAHMLAELDRDLALNADDAVIRSHLDPTIWEGADPKVLARLTAVYREKGAAGLRAELGKASTAAKVKPVGKSGQIAQFDPDTMEPAGGVKLRRGEKVQITYRGSQVRLPSGEVVQITKPIVVRAPRPDPVKMTAGKLRDELSESEVGKGWSTLLPAKDLNALKPDLERAVQAVREGATPAEVDLSLRTAVAERRAEQLRTVLARERARGWAPGSPIRPDLLPPGTVRLASPRAGRVFDPAEQESQFGLSIPAGATVQGVDGGYAVSFQGVNIIVEKPTVKILSWPDRGPLPSAEPGVPTIQEITRALGRAPSRYSDPGYAEAQERLRHMWASAVDGPYGTLRVETGGVTKGWGDAVLAARADIVDSTGRKVGTVTRQIMKDSKGNLTAYHAFLQIDSGVQGSGFADRFNANLFAWYRRSGIKKVKVHADIDVGGYTWATQGFDFESTREATKYLKEALAKIDKALRAGSLPHGLTQQDLDEIRAYILEMQAGRVPASAPALSQFGRKPGQGGKTDTWAGKWLMLGTSWHGLLRL